MSLKMRGNSPDKRSMRSLVDSLRTVVNNQGDALANEQQTRQLISLESLDHASANMVQSHFDEVTAVLKDTMVQLGFEAFDDTTAAGQLRMENALTAGAIAAMAAGSPSAYAQAAYTNTAQAEKGVTLVDPIAQGPAGRMDYRDKVALEAFDDRELREHLPYSIAFNVFASRQDDFAETFYPTTVVTPDQAGLDLTVSRMLVFTEVRHAITGAAANFNKKNLIDAAVDPSILADESTRLVPVRQEDDSNAEYFVAEAAVAPSFTTVAGINVPTAPLAMGKEVDLIGVSSYAPLIGAGVIDNTDSIDARIQLDALYLLPGAGKKGVKFNVSRLPRNTFVKSIEGNYREMNLQFATSDLIISADSKAVDGSVVAEFADIASNNYTVRVKVNVNGVANVEIGNVKVYASSLTVASITDENGNDVSLTAGTGATVKAAIEGMSLIGYDLHVNRTNANRRTRGLLLDTTWETERYTIPLASPISVPAPIASNKEAADLKALISAARIRNSNNAVTQLFNYADTLEAYVKGPKRDGEVPQVQGMGRFLVQPFFERHTLDLTESINSIRSQDKAADVAAVLVNAVRDIAYRMYRDSRYQAALDTITGGTGETPTLVIGTDQVLVRHLMVSGDSRTFGTSFDKFEIKSSLDKRMSNKIVLSFVRGKSDGPDPLTFGTHAWIPELTSTVQVTRNGAVTKETMVQPRTLHVNNLPVMAIIDVEGLSEVLGDRVSTPATDTDIDNPYMDGLTYP